MHRKGVNYDAGVVMGTNWRPEFDHAVVRRELEIIRSDLHCTAVRIVGRSLPRLRFAAESALDAGLEVWLSPTFWNRTAQPTARYLAKVARAAEELRDRFPGRIVLVVGTELTLFSRGILPGRSFLARVGDPELRTRIRGGRSWDELHRFLGTLVAAARGVYRGPLTYASLAWEPVDWSLFDFAGVDAYRVASMGDRYLETLRPALASGKPVVVTEFGFDTASDSPTADGFLSSSGLKPSAIDVRSQFFHQLPIVGRWVRPRMLRPLRRDEALQARRLEEQLEILERAGVDGAFVSNFLSQITPYDPDPRFDLDSASMSLVRYRERGRGTTYPELPWEPKESFRAVARFYASH